LTDVNAGDIGPTVSVKISDGKMGSHPRRENRRGRPPPGNSQEPAQDSADAEGGLPNKTPMNPHSHRIQIRNPRRV
jgi:hypothetical protein